MTPAAGAPAGRVAIVGAGIAGVATAVELRRRAPSVAVTVFEATDAVGGRIAGGPFAGVESVDAGADAFLARVPDGIEFADAVGLGGTLVSPEPVGAAIWRGSLVDLPDGLVLGVPARLAPLARTPLLSWRGKARAALEPLLPRTPLDADSVGAFVRARLGDEVHERLVDALVGSIYATDTDHFSLAEVPQLADLARSHRSVLLGARRSAAPGTASAGAAPVFAAPRRGMADLVRAGTAALEGAGGEVHVGRRVEEIAGTAGGWLVDGERFDGVVLACPASASAGLVADVAPEAATLLEAADAADVVLVTLHVAPERWPDRLRGRSGYLVPKPDQRWVTAVSFGSQKWAHWRPPGGGEILRVSLGRDGMPVLHLDDDAILAHVLADLDRHLGIALDPIEVRITRWPGAFAQYRPHHRGWVERVERALPVGIFLTGASYRGIGIPACIRDGRATAGRCADHLVEMRES